MAGKKSLIAPSTDAIVQKAKRGRKPKVQSSAVKSAEKTKKVKPAKVNAAKKISKTDVPRKVGRPKGSTKAVKLDAAVTPTVKKSLVKQKTAKTTSVVTAPKTRGRKPGLAVKSAVKKSAAVKSKSVNKAKISGTKAAASAAERILAPLQANIVKAQAKLLSAQKKLVVQAEKQLAKSTKQHKSALKNQKIIEKNLKLAQTRAKKVKTPMAQKKLATLQKTMNKAREAIETASLSKAEAEALVAIAKARIQLAKQGAQSVVPTVQLLKLEKKPVKTSEKSSKKKGQVSAGADLVGVTPIKGRGRPVKSDNKKASVQSTRAMAKAVANSVSKTDSETMHAGSQKPQNQWRPVVVPPKAVKSAIKASSEPLASVTSLSAPKSAETKLVEARPVVAKPVENKSIETKSIEAKPAEKSAPSVVDNQDVRSVFVPADDL